jgi:hypothetical protein
MIKPKKITKPMMIFLGIFEWGALFLADARGMLVSPFKAVLDTHSLFLTLLQAAG